MSYSEILRASFALDCRAVMESDWYRRAFPGPAQPGQRPRDGLHDDGSGRSLCYLGRRTLTGRGGDYILLDDLIKPSDAMSEAVRTAVNEWIDRTIYTRLDDKTSDVIILVMQRLHLEDPPGHLLAKDEVWDHLSARDRASGRWIPIGPGWLYPRKP